MFSDPSSQFAKARGSDQLVKFIDDHGYRHIFGLPGSSMAAAIHAFQNCGAEYVPSIHESVTMAMADGYARVAGSGLGMVYMMPGVANCVANLYNAWRDESPVMLLASQQGTRLRTPNWTVCEGDLVGLTAPYTRLAQELAPGMPLRPWLERARQTSLGPLPGPVFLSLQENVISDPQTVEEARTSVRPVQVCPDVSAIADALRTAERPLIVVGGQLARFGGAKAIEELSRDQAIPICYESGFNDRLGAAPGHPNVFGNIIAAAAPLEQEADVVLVIGARLMMDAHVRPMPWFPKAKFIAHVNNDPEKLETTMSAHWAAACDPGKVAMALRDALAAQPASAELREKRTRQMEAVRGMGRIALLSMISHYLDAFEPIRDALDHGWLVDESTLGTFTLQECLTSQDGSRYMNTTGASLGWGTGAAAGVALASGEPVTLTMGDGATRFGALGLWTIAARKLPVTIIVFDNGGYGSTRMFERLHIEKLGPEAMPQSAGYLGSDLRELGPSVQSIIEGFGIPCHVPKPDDDMRKAVMAAWDKGRTGPNAVVIPMAFGG